MMTTHDVLEALENYNKQKQPDLITENKKGKWIAYFRTSKNRIATGKTETEALENLKNMIDKLIK
jgi:predicted RNase H-like HicB family nuclease